MSDHVYIEMAPDRHHYIAGAHGSNRTMYSCVTEYDRDLRAWVAHGDGDDDRRVVGEEGEHRHEVAMRWFATALDILSPTPCDDADVLRRIRDMLAPGVDPVEWVRSALEVAIATNEAHDRVRTHPGNTVARTLLWQDAIISALEDALATASVARDR